MANRLFAVYLGGRVVTCNTELHDVVFAAGETIESTYDQLMDKWFGDFRRLHVDSWVDLELIDGHRVTLTKEPSTYGKKLYFVNLGGYAPGQFTELHENAFCVAATEAEVKRRAKSELLVGMQQVHTDDLHDVDDCLEVTEVDGFHVHLEPTTEPEVFQPNNGYHIIPEAVVAAYAAKRKARKNSL